VLSKTTVRWRKAEKNRKGNRLSGPEIILKKYLKND
jgi:hypothetical protein